MFVVSRKEIGILIQIEPLTVFQHCIIQGGIHIDRLGHEEEK